MALNYDVTVVGAGNGGHALRLLGYSSTYLSSYQTAQLAVADIKEGR